MGTRSAIAVAHGDVIKAVYCHYDGYLEHNGVILQEHYNSAKANHLVSQGDMSVLGTDIGEKHSFGWFLEDNADHALYKQYNGKWCTFYARDRGEEGADWSVFHSRDTFVKEMAHSGCEYFYLMDGGVWYVGTGDEFQRLETALESIKENENA